jgi:hypothetical protein
MCSKKRLFPETDEETEEFLIETYRRMSPSEKLQRMTELTQQMWREALADVGRRYPNATPRECQLRVASRWIDADTMRKAFGWDPDKEGS